MQYKLQIFGMNAELMEVWVIWRYYLTVCVIWELVLESWWRCGWFGDTIIEFVWY